MQEHFQEKEDEQQSSSDERIRVTAERCARPRGAGGARGPAHALSAPSRVQTSGCRVFYPGTVERSRSDSCNTVCERG